MKRILNLHRYHWLAVAFLSGVFFATFAFASYSLFHLSMANIDFLREHGSAAIMEGALLQLLEIFLRACFAMACYLGFKICETELTSRYHRWVEK